MKRATMTIPDDLERDLNTYIDAQETRPSLTVIFQAALRQYLQERLLLKMRRYRAPKRRLKVSPAKCGSGIVDISARHDKYIGDQ